MAAFFSSPLAENPFIPSRDLPRAGVFRFSHGKAALFLCSFAGAGVFPHRGALLPDGYWVVGKRSLSFGGPLFPLTQQCSSVAAATLLVFLGVWCNGRAMVVLTLLVVASCKSCYRV